MMVKRESMAQNDLFRKRLGMRLRMARQSLTVAQVATGMQVSRQTIHAWESGRCRIGVDQFYRLMGVCGREPSEVLSWVVNDMTLEQEMVAEREQFQQQGAEEEPQEGDLTGWRTIP